MEEPTINQNQQKPIEQADWEYVNDYDKFTEQVRRFEQIFIDE